MKAWLKNDGEKEIILNEEKDTEAAARKLGWVPKDEFKPTAKPVEEMTLEELHAVADSLDKKMAVNIGLDKAREKVKAMLEAK